MLSTFASWDEGPGFNPWVDRGAFLCGVCMFFRCSRGLSPGDTGFLLQCKDLQIRSNLPSIMHMNGCLCLCWPCDGLVTCPGCSLLCALTRQGLAPASP